MFGFGKRKTPVEQALRFRIVRTDRDGETTGFTIEEWTSHYARDNMLWLPVNRHDFQCHHKTMEEAETEFAKLFAPVPVVTRTVVAESQAEFMIRKGREFFDEVR